MVLRAICCWGTEYCKCELLGLSRNQNVKLAFILIILLILVLSTAIARLQNNSAFLLEQLGCQQGSDSPYVCLSQELRYRGCYAGAVLHALLMACMLMRNQTAKTLNEGAWALKLLFVIALASAFLFLSPGLATFLQTSSIYLSILWYVVQSLVLVDLIYAFDSFFNDLSQASPRFHLLKAALSVIFLMISLSFNVSSYLRGRDEPMLWVSVANSIMLALGLALVLMRGFRGNSLLVFSLVMISTTTMGYYLRVREADLKDSFFPYIQMALAGITILGTLSPGSNRIRTKKSSLNELLSLNTSKEEEDTRYVSSNKWVVFHLIFFVVVFVLPSVLGGLSNGDTGWEDGAILYRAMGWGLFYAAYSWSLIASRIYSDRQFNELEHYFKEFELN